MNDVAKIVRTYRVTAGLGNVFQAERKVEARRSASESGAALRLLVSLRLSNLHKHTAVMKPNAQPITFLDEHGVKITATHISVPGHDFPLRQLQNVAVDQKRSNLIAALLGKEKLKFILSISTLSDQTMKPVFEAEDGELMQRIHEAIRKAANSYGANVTRGVPRR